MPILILVLVSAVTLGLEILLTNVFSIALFSSHGAVAIALALLGVASGGAIGFLEGPLDAERWRRRSLGLLILLALAVVGSIWGLLQIEFVPSSVSYWQSFDSAEFLAQSKLAYAIPIAFLPFLLSGYLQVGIFKVGAERFGTLYGADLVGATVGAVVFQLLLYPLGLRGVALTMGAVLLLPVLLSLVGDLRPLRAAGLLVAVGGLVLLGGHSSFKVQHCAGQSTWMGPTGRLVEEIWTPLARIALLERADGAQSYVVNNSFAAYAPNDEATFQQYSRELFRVPMQAKAGGDVLVVASGAGPGIVMAHRFGARSIDAVEIADGIVHHIVEERADDPLNPYLIDGVEWHVADARSFVMKADKAYDLILLRTVEGFSATGQLASAWSTNFITSQEAVAEYLEHLSDDGLYVFATAAYPGAPNDWFGMDPLSHPITQVRLRSLAAGLELAGVEEPERHLVVLKHANWFVHLLKRTPFRPEEVQRLLDIADELPPSALPGTRERVYAELCFPPQQEGLRVPPNVRVAPQIASGVAEILASTTPIGLSALPAAFDPVEAHPLSDDRPYKYKSGLFDFSGEGFEFILGDSYRKLVTVVGLLALLFVALPFVLKRKGGGDAGPVSPRLALTAVLTGFGFMFVEMASMFRFQLYLHHPTIAMIVVLSSMILGAGLGSMHSARVERDAGQVARYCGLSAVASLVVFAAPQLLHGTLLGLPLMVAAVLLFAVFCGLGYLLGHVVPLSIAVFAPSAPRLVAWTWAVTVTFSVFGTILSAILFRSAGVTVVAGLGIACYGLLALALRGGGRPAVSGASAVAGLLLVALLSCSTETQPAAPAPEPPVLPEYVERFDARVAELVRSTHAALVEAPRDPERWMELGRVYEAHAESSLAIPCYLGAVQLDDGQARWWYRLAMARGGSDRIAEALEALERAIALEEGHTPAHWRRGQWLLELDRAPEARGAFARSLELDPSDAAGQLGLAQVHLQQREYREAVQALDGHAVLRGPNAGFARKLLGTALQRLGEEDRARLLLASARNATPSYRDPWNDELDSYRRGMAAINRQARALIAGGRVLDAVEVLEQARELEPEHVPILRTLGAAYAAVGRTKPAYDVLVEAATLEPGNVELRIDATWARAMFGQLGPALDDVEALLVEEPTNHKALTLRAQLLFDLERGAEAVEAFALARSHGAREPRMLVDVGKTQLELGRPADALGSFALAAEQDPMSQDAWIGQTIAQIELGDPAAAAASLARAEELAAFQRGDDPEVLSGLRVRIDEMQEESGDEAGG